MANISTQRTPLGERSSNNARGPELTPDKRGRILGMYECGHNVPFIMARLKLSRYAVRYTIDQDELRNDAETLPRPGQKKSFSPLDERNILRCARTHPKFTYAKLKDFTGVECSHKTISRILASHGITNWRCKKRPNLTKTAVKKRYAWAKLRLHWTAEEWGLIMWSDECSVERGAGKEQEWCFRTPAQKWERKMIQTYKCGKDIRVMVWGCFWDTGRTGLYLMDRDFESKKHRYSANSYLEVLDAMVAPAMQRLNDPGYIFMQDNASIHTALTVHDWFRNAALICLDWPPYSPDLNPIEHAWAKLKEMVDKEFPEISRGLGKGEYNIEQLGSALQACWDMIPKEFFDALYQSMPSRVRACYEAKGWHTKY